MEGNIINEVYYGQMNKASSSKWSQGDLGTSNIGVSKDTKLAAAWYRDSGCRNCDANIHVIFQDPKEQVSLANGTGRGWDVTTPPIPKPDAGTPLAYMKSWMAKDNTTDMMLFYDQENSNVTTASLSGIPSKNSVLRSMLLSLSVRFYCKSLFMMKLTFVI